MRTLPSGPACRQALSISTPASRSIHSGGALISTASSGVSALTAGPTARNRSAQAWASVLRSTGSSPGGGGRESNRASQSMSSTRLRSRWLSPWIRASASRYSPASRGADRATSASARITLSGVRSSCEASAVNSSWRRRDCSTGASARRPTTSRPPNIASSRNGPAMISPYSSRRLVCSSPATLWPATSQPSPSRASLNRNGPSEAASAENANPSRGERTDGGAGASGLCPVTAPPGSVAQRKTGAESASMSPGFKPRKVRRPTTGWLTAAGSPRATASRMASRASAWSVMCWARIRLKATAPIT